MSKEVAVIYNVRAMAKKRWKGKVVIFFPIKKSV